eukprot:1160690-Pelagomonas_calceolata.AAC.5
MHMCFPARPDKGRNAYMPALMHGCLPSCCLPSCCLPLCFYLHAANINAAFLCAAFLCAAYRNAAFFCAASNVGHLQAPPASAMAGQNGIPVCGSPTGTSTPCTRCSRSLRSRAAPCLVSGLHSQRGEEIYLGKHGPHTAC